MIPREPDRVSPIAAQAITEVGIALVYHGGSYLVGCRGPGSTLEGLWEFPGGKCLPGESPAVCAVRECREETGLEIEVITLKHDLRHTFPYGTVHLYFFDCRLGTMEAVQPGGGFAWVPVERLSDLNFPEPNRALIDMLREKSLSNSNQQRLESAESGSVR